MLVQSNFGIREEFSVLGVPVGHFWPEDAVLSQHGQRETGSIIVIVATDAPLHPTQLQRLAKRGALGIGRTGTTGGVNSGDIMLAFSTRGSRRWNPAELQHGDNVKSLSSLEDKLMDPLGRAAAHATEEAVVNAMLAAEDMTCIKPAGGVLKALDSARLRHIFDCYRPLAGLISTGAPQ